MTAIPLPASLAANPRLDQWVRFETHGVVALFTGKVELGQGLLTALTQIAADELDVACGRVHVTSGDTGRSPREGATAGSRSIEESGMSIRLVCATIRQLFLERAAARLACRTADLSLEDGRFLRAGTATGLDYWSLSSEVDLARDVSDGARPKEPWERRLIGHSVPRIDLPEKLRGRGFIHDLTSPGLLHARVIRQPRRGACLVAVTEAARRRIAGQGCQLVQQGDFLAVVAESEIVAVKAAELLADACTWEGGVAIPDTAGQAGFLRAQESRDRVIETTLSARVGSLARSFEANYSRPYLAHASLAPACALATFDQGRLTVRTHSQGVFELRVALARVLGLAVDSIAVLHHQGAGCYGHNGADDVALDAALIAMQLAPRPIRVQWTREDELRYGPFGAATSSRLRADLDEGGRPLEWTTEIWSGPHSQRPTQGGRINLLAAHALPGMPIDPEPTDLPETAGGGATRNAVPLYAVGRHRIIHHLLPALPVRTSSLRSLGAFFSVFTTESFMDELAELAGEDPVHYRLSLLSDSRARQVIETVVSMSNWSDRGEQGAGRAKGIGFARYKNKAAYCAVVAEVEVEEQVRLLGMWCAVDAGLVINPDGVVNQIEGGIVQSASWVLKEAVRFDDGRVMSNSWDTYPILRFSEVPPIEVRLVASQDARPLGVGEAAQGPTAAAIGNAVAHALGVRCRDLPLDRDQIMATLLSAPR